MRGRIADPNPPYPAKAIPRAVTAAVLYLALVPTALAAIGLLVTAHRRREYLPLHVMLALTMSSYLAWVVAQDAWALKTKYIMFLLPVFVAYVVAGVRLDASTAASAVVGRGRHRACGARAGVASLPARVRGRAPLASPRLGFRISPGRETDRVV